MEHEDEAYSHDEHYDHESTYDAHESDPHANQEPEGTSEEPQPEEIDEKKQRNPNKSPPGAATQQPNNYAAQPIPQQFPQQFPPQPAYYQTANPVQAPPQHFPPQVSPHRHPYNKAPPTSPYTPAAASPGINYPNGAPAMHQNGGYAHAPQVNGNPTAGYPAPSPYIYRPPPSGNVGWSTGLFDCMDDPNNALITACCPCFTFGQIAEIVDSGHTTCATSGILYGCIAAFTLLPCLISCTYRTKMRSQYDLVEIPAADWITHIFCEWCALCQEYRELKNRGIDPAIGWHGNMMRNHQQPQVAMMPPANQTMQGPHAF